MTDSAYIYYICIDVIFIEMTSVSVAQGARLDDFAARHLQYMRDTV